MPRGVIKFFNDSKGYGFITSDETDSIFVHYSSIQADGYRTLKEGEEVLFEIKDGQRGPEAVNVSKI
jgi:CspA family cold shock protein